MSTGNDTDFARALEGAAGSLVPGQVMHARMDATPHRFAYDVFSVLVDVDRLDELDRDVTGFAHNRFSLAAIHDRDHGTRDGTPLGAHVRKLMAEAGCPVDGGHVLLLCYPRILGFVFNPLAVYYAYDRDGALKGLVYEVRNTFGEMHAYVAPVLAGERSAAGIRQTRKKLFFVSPFLDMDMTYHFRMGVPGELIRVRIFETQDDKPALAATFAGTRAAMTGASLARLCLKLPFVTLKVIAAIHFEAARLWLRGAPFFFRGKPPAAASFADQPRTDHKDLAA